MKVTTTNDRVFNFIQVASGWLVKNEGANAKTKMGYAISRVLPRAQKIVEQYQEEYRYKLEDANNDHCMTDEKTKEILKDSRGDLKFTQEGTRLRNQAIRDWLKETKDKPVEIEAYFATELLRVPEDITFAEADAFTGFVMKEEAAAAVGD